jgi:glutamate-1-semialdehyde 2,1-aminomutase
MLNSNTQSLSATALTDALMHSTQAYVRANPASAAQFIKATEAMPGGNTRSVLYYAPFPLTIVKGKGARLWDADGHEYRDFIAEFSAGIFGHSNPVIRSAIDVAMTAASISVVITSSRRNSLLPSVSASQRWSGCDSPIREQRQTF